jgi:hypothetical protein
MDLVVQPSQWNISLRMLNSLTHFVFIYIPLRMLNSLIHIVLVDIPLRMLNSLTHLVLVVIPLTILISTRTDGFGFSAFSVEYLKEQDG